MNTPEQFIKEQYGLGNRDIDAIALKGSTIAADMKEYSKQLLEEYTNRIVENVTATLYRSENDERLDDAVVDKESITSQLQPFLKEIL